MPNIKSAKKRVRVSEKRTLRNKIVKSSMKTFIKKFDNELSSGDAAKAADALRVASKKVDQAAAKGVITKNCAARRKSAMALRLNKNA